MFVGWDRQILALNRPKPARKALIVFPATMLWYGQIAGRGNFRGNRKRRHRTTTMAACVRHAMEE